MQCMKFLFASFMYIHDTSLSMLSATPSESRRSPAVAFSVMGVEFCLDFGTKARAWITRGLKDSAPWTKINLWFTHNKQCTAVAETIIPKHGNTVTFFKAELF